MNQPKLTKQQLVNYMHAYYRNNDHTISKSSLESLSKETLVSKVLECEGECGLTNASNCRKCTLHCKDDLGHDVEITGLFYPESITAYCEHESVRLLNVEVKEESK